MSYPSFEDIVRSTIDEHNKKALKYDEEKMPLDLLPFEALEEVAKVLDHGAKKYAANNWRKGFKWSRLIAAALRHIFAFAKGEDNDPDSGLSHLAHAMCMLLFLLGHVLNKYGSDDRYKILPKKTMQESGMPKDI